ncbi:hypothetical protein BpHYR1_011184 [Brachionus plicatilis]|uniref:Uncharacterized protein n=1 Tax=Brachionus plicatilis TaxID=10195 RepID=A0A3M7SNI1_BRAPC|nr:hypothetical protein BpHYR1_011184 [Brachionus plicatilis]
MASSSSSRLKFFDKLHKFTITGILGVSLISAGLVLYNFYLFKKEGVPMLIEKYRTKVEEDIELKQREAEYLEERRQAEKKAQN